MWYPDSHEGVVEPECPQPLIDLAFGAEQVDPGHHLHQILDPEWGEDEEQPQPTPSPRLAGYEICNRVVDDHAQCGRHEDIRDRPQCDDTQPTAEEVGDCLAEYGRIPIDRVPFRSGTLKDGVDLTHGYGEDGVEGHQDEEDQPDDAGQRESRPHPAFLAHGVVFGARGEIGRHPPPTSVRHSPELARVHWSFHSFSVAASNGPWTQAVSSSKSSGVTKAGSRKSATHPSPIRNSGVSAICGG